jgi:enediyne polyketide synthase
MSARVAIVGLAAVYPDANSVQELWENVIAQRRAFRRLPRERLDPDGYFDPDRDAPDRTYAIQAAVIEGYSFDRRRFHIFKESFRAADHTHWLALDVASRALAHAGFPEAEGLPREATGVIVGNTLTGEFSRANNLRLRWPFVRRIIAGELSGFNHADADADAFLAGAERRFKEPFPEINENSLPGGMSNTIAGRINSHFGLTGGGYTTDGACASSLLAIVHGCSALLSRDLDAVLAGGVDLSLDPFELVGFAKAGALANEQMRVYDTRANGFWPGEGCGFVLLMREDDALALRRPIYALIRGWGMSSDGQPSLTRPDVDGQRLALSRAYHRAGFGIDTVTCFEGHGTGTPIGDEVELSALLHELRAAHAATPAVIGSIKANIGHTKAAAGMAGLIKVVCALQSRILPPHAGCDSPCELVRKPDSLLKVLPGPVQWPPDRPPRAGVSAMGFGGLNVHVSLSAVDDDCPRRTGTTIHLPASFPIPASLPIPASGIQDTEVFFFSAENPGELRQQILKVAGYAAQLSLSELTDLGAALATKCGAQPSRAAVVAAEPDELHECLERLARICEECRGPVRDAEHGVFFQPSSERMTRLGYVFPGQSAPLHLHGGMWRKRFLRLYDGDGVKDQQADTYATSIAQPAICAAALAALRVLDELGLEASVAIGHSLGELTALHWAGAMDGTSLLRLARARGETMEKHARPGGRMAAIFAPSAEVSRLIGTSGVEIACFNTDSETVVAGSRPAVEAFTSRLQVSGLSFAMLPVEHAFHSCMMESAQPHFRAILDHERIIAPSRSVYSTITGRPWRAQDDVRTLLVEQLCRPVRFTEAFGQASAHADLWLEVGPGEIFGRLARRLGAECYPLDAGGDSLRPLLAAVGAVYTAGANLRCAALFEGRFTRPFNLDWRPVFFANPCEKVCERSSACHVFSSGSHTPSETTSRNPGRGLLRQAPVPRSGSSRRTGKTPGMLAVLRELIARKTGVEPEEISETHPLKAKYDLGSNGARLLAVEALQSMGLDLRSAPGAEEFKFGTCSVASLASFLQDAVGSPGYPRDLPKNAFGGLAPWVETFQVELTEAPVEAFAPAGSGTKHQDRGGWELVAPESCAIHPKLREGCSTLPGWGILVYFPSKPVEADLHSLLKAAQQALQMPRATFVHVHHQGVATGGGLIRTLKMEAPQLRTAILSVPDDGAPPWEWVRSEVLQLLAREPSSHVEAHLSPDGRRMEPRLRHCTLPSSLPEMALPGPGDAFLVSGGARGFTLQWLLDLARETGARFALLGRAVPADDPRLSQNLRVLSDQGVEFRYYPADVRSESAVTQAVSRAVSAFGPITGLIHAAAATDDTSPLGELTAERLSGSVQTKVGGLRNLLAAVDKERVRWVFALGSIIARTGLPGEAAYAVANEWMAYELEQFQVRFPRCRCLTLELSAVEGDGRAARGDRVFLESLGVQFMPVTGVLPLLRRTFLAPALPSRLLICSRFGTPPTLELGKPDGPALRFSQVPRVHYPGVELITETELSWSQDPYLRDHAVGGEHLLPAVLGLEAMVQVAVGLLGAGCNPVLRDVRFVTRIAVPETAGLFPEDRCVLRSLAQRTAAGSVEVGLELLRQDATDGTVHFRAKLEDVSRVRPPIDLGRLPFPSDAWSTSPIAAAGWYGHLYFHQGRFQRVRAYHLLSARRCVFELEPEQPVRWFHRTLPQGLLLGDPAARDAAIHGVQACIPHRRLLPVAVEEIRLRDPSVPRRYVEARERAAGDLEYVYDVTLYDENRVAVERWRGLRLHDAGKLDFGGPWPLALLSVYVERCALACLPNAQFRLELTPRQQHGENRRLNRRQGPIDAYDAHGKPLGVAGMHVSRAHAAELTMIAFDAPHEIACDFEAISGATREQWRDMLQPDHFALAHEIASCAPEPFATAATRVWCAWETLHGKLGTACAEISLASRPDNDWILLSTGQYQVVTGRVPAPLIPSVRHGEHPTLAERDLVFAVGVPRLR